MTQDEIILNCPHPDKPCDVSMPGGRRVKCCSDCWNASVEARRAADQARNEAQRIAGVEYWTSRGITIGETVEAIAWGIFGAFRITGTAKAGAVGAYVSSKCQRGRLDPRYWHKAAPKDLPRAESPAAEPKEK